MGLPRSQMDEFVDALNATGGTTQGTQYVRPELSPDATKYTPFGDPNFFDKQQQHYQDLAGQYGQNRNQGFGYQANAIDSYRAGLNGDGQGLQQLGQGLQNSQAYQQSLAAGARGNAYARMAAGRNGQVMNAQLGAGYNNQADLIRAQEAQNARAGLAAVGNQTAQQGIQGQLAYNQTAQDLANQQMRAKMAYDSNRTQNILRRKGIDAGVSIGDDNRSAAYTNSMIGATSGAIGSGLVAAASAGRPSNNGDYSNGIYHKSPY